MKRAFLFLSVFTLAASVLSAQIAPKVIRSTISGTDVIIYPTGVQDVVTIKGSLPAGDAMAGDGNIAVPTLCGMLLDQGTTKQDKFAIANKLEAVGATIDFNVGTQLVDISAKCLKKDVPLVISLIAEQLRSPAFTPEEFAKAQAQYAGSLQRSLESTDFRATDAFTRAVYPLGHPNRQPPTEELLAAVQSAKLDEVKAFHAKYYGPAHLTLVLVGDVDVPVIQREAAAAFAGWTGGSDVIHPAKATSTDAPREQTVFMPDKTSVTVIMGHASGLRYRDADYQALKTATAILGSGFTGRLMANVRDKEGLTYGIGSYVADDTFVDGSWRIAANFAPQLLDKGLDSTKRQLIAWYRDGVTDAELAQRKTDLAGSYKVGLSTTGGMAGTILTTLNRDLDLAFIDEYPGRVAALTKEQVNGAIKKHLDPEKMVLIKAGTVTGATPPK